MALVLKLYRDQFIVGFLGGQCFVRMCSAIADGHSGRAFLFFMALSALISFWARHIMGKR